MSEVWHKSKMYPFTKFKICRRKEGICNICDEEIYYGIEIEKEGIIIERMNICRRCAKIITYIRLSPWGCSP